MLGECMFCGQKMMAEIDDQESANKYATDHCKCKEGQNYRSKLDAIDKNVADLGYCLEGLPEEVVSALKVIVEAMYNDRVLKVSLKTEDGASTTLTRKCSSVKIVKSKSNKVEFENYEV